MRGTVAKRLRRQLFVNLASAGAIEQSRYQIRTVKRSPAKGGGQAQMLVVTGFRSLYRKLKREYKEARRAC